MSKIIRALALALGISVIISLCGFEGECQEIRDSVLRLHVLAHSDSAEDQALKLLVRDTVIDETAALFDEAETEQEARAAVAAHLAGIEQAAQQRVYDEGYDYPVRAELTEMYFTTRTYGNVTLPAGNYEAVRITIGDAAGRNWWCVVFPPMCVSAATDAADLSDVLTDDQRDIVENSGRYEVRLKVVEWFGTAAAWIKQKLS